MRARFKPFSGDFFQRHFATNRSAVFRKGEDFGSKELSKADLQAFLSKCGI